MNDVQVIKVSLPLKSRFAVAGGETDRKTNLIVVLNNRYTGEAAASVKGGPTIEQLEAELRRGVSYIKRRKKLDRRALEAISNYDISPVARSALMAMVLNFVSGETERYPWEILELGSPLGIRNSITVSLGKPADVIAAIKASDFPIIKVKMGNDGDAELVSMLDEVKGKELRVDANGAWSCEKAEEMIFHLSKHGVRTIEQPTGVDHVSDWPLLKGKNTDVELVLDEGVATFADYEKYSEHVDGINIKMEKSGGIIEAAKIARKAREDKKKVMLGCMVESSVGIAQSVYMSALADYHDLDAPQLLVDDIADGIVYDREAIHVDREIIGGPSLKRDVVEKYIQE